MMAVPPPERNLKVLPMPFENVQRTADVQECAIAYVAVRRVVGVFGAAALTPEFDEQAWETDFVNVPTSLPLYGPLEAAGRFSQQGRRTAATLCLRGTTEYGASRHVDVSLLPQQHQVRYTRQDISAEGQPMAAPERRWEITGAALLMAANFLLASCQQSPLAEAEGWEEVLGTVELGISLLALPAPRNDSVALVRWPYTS
jgi:hypothetical protein